ncbi:hypothetical protein LPB72_11120 [Hydrogenophaga crassostreae]|uniref:YdhG-like domain-containing protein n=1 Tax=Hydrogenophaga crassostreae TaxID=1763535 RepID=A0A167I331_9BURK|nr:DUF1801 domain-containing protein [Hydrogenophaga crassostreae]AOW15605.1 hypothetical protein LPB072_12500 [Hydrogenophaga crassostreae]OAD42070.1 hypothetical protein LPB72_11120 [Hydrogenophaga crassostreae]
MAKQSVETLMQDIRFVSEESYQIVEAVRALVRKSFKDASEEVKYGGILFASGIQFTGVFAYKAHVSVEFNSGAGIADELGHLEGAGKGRRHVKLRSIADLEHKHLAQYLALALEAAKGG